MTRQYWLGSIAAVLAAIVLIYFSRSISEYFVGLFFKSNVHLSQNQKVSTLSQKSGAVSIRRTGKSTFEPIKLSENIEHLDQLKVEKDSSAEISFSSNWKIKLLEGATATFELYRPSQTDSPALVSIGLGDYSVVEVGLKGQLFIMKDKRVFDPEFNQPSKSRIIELTSPAQKIEPIVNVELPEAMTTDLPPSTPTASAITPGKMPDKILSGDEETLSSAYIERVLSSQTNSLRRCQLNSLRDNKPSVGQLLMSLTISPNGKITRIKILQDQIKNEQLISCATSVVERTILKSFEGLPITLTYPLEFK